MKRLIAYVFDYMVMYIILIVVQQSIVRVEDKHWILVLVLIFMYFFLNDLVFKGESLGKKIVGFHVEKQDMSIVKFAFIHSAWKLLFTCISIIAITIYFSLKCTMPYDRKLYKAIGNKKYL